MWPGADVVDVFLFGMVVSSVVSVCTVDGTTHWHNTVASIHEGTTEDKLPVEIQLLSVRGETLVEPTLNGSPLI